MLQRGFRHTRGPISLDPGGESHPADDCGHKACPHKYRSPAPNPPSRSRGLARGRLMASRTGWGSGRVLVCLEDPLTVLYSVAEDGPSFGSGLGIGATGREILEEGFDHSLRVCQDILRKAGAWSVKFRRGERKASEPASGSTNISRVRGRRPRLQPHRSEPDDLLAAMGAPTDHITATHRRGVGQPQTHSPVARVDHNRPAGTGISPDPWRRGAVKTREPSPIHFLSSASRLLSLNWQIRIPCAPHCPLPPGIAEGLLFRACGPYQEIS